MIPLSQWLSGREDRMRLHGSLTEAAATDDHQIPSEVLLVDEAYARGRHDEHADMLVKIEALQADHRIMLEQQEAALNARWEGIVSSGLTGSVAAAFEELRRNLETSIYEVLRPFLDEAVARSASEQLVGHVRAEAARVAVPIIEIRSPAALHETLAKLMSDRGIAVSVSEGDLVEVTARDGTSRFEGMASRWIAVLDGGDA